MPKVTKHKNTVTVEYTPRTSTFTITKAEHDLIIAMQAYDLQMIDFIIDQYNIGVIAAEQIVNTVIEAHAINIKGSGNEDREQKIDWSKVKKGTWIHVKDFHDAQWIRRAFIHFSAPSRKPFTCLSEDGYYAVTWKYAELIKE